MDGKEEDYVLRNQDCPLTFLREKTRGISYPTTQWSLQQRISRCMNVGLLSSYSRVYGRHFSCRFILFARSEEYHHFMHIFSHDRVSYSLEGCHSLFHRQCLLFVVVSEHLMMILFEEEDRNRDSGHFPFCCIEKKDCLLFRCDRSSFCWFLPTREAGHY
jgi:hypothetical protein